MISFSMECPMKIPNLMRTSIRFGLLRFLRFGSKSSKNLLNEIKNISFFVNFFKFLMIRFDRIELATFMKKSLDSMDFSEKEALNSADRTQTSTKLKK
jgi:hypothetical protein